jgi:hypothetical protein
MCVLDLPVIIYLKTLESARRGSLGLQTLTANPSILAGPAFVAGEWAVVQGRRAEGGTKPTSVFRDVILIHSCVI